MITNVINQWFNLYEQVTKIWSIGRFKANRGQGNMQPFGNCKQNSVAQVLVKIREQKRGKKEEEDEERTKINK